MIQKFLGRMAVLSVSLVVMIGGSSPIQSEPSYGIAMYGAPQLPPDFVSLPYVNQDAPKGGRIVFGEVGGYDSLNPHILKGRAPWGVQAHVFESLLGRNWDEPFTLYGLLAESVEVGPNREWVAFTLRPEARFSDGSPVTVEDVIWSFEILGEEGHPRFHGSWAKVDTIEQTGERSVRITFNAPDREMPLIMGLRPIFQKAQWEGRDFAASSMTAPIGTSPYVIDEADPGRRLVLRRNPDYWGADLPFNRGQHNFDEIVYDYYADSAALFEAFKAGNITVLREGNAARWAEQYNFPAVSSGAVEQAEIPHERPSGIYGLVFNTRRDVFKDWRVRDALMHAFNYEFTAQTQTGGADPRITSFFANSVLGIGRVTSNSDFSEEEDGITDFLSEDPMNAGAIGASMLFAYSAMQGEQETDIRIRHSRMELFPVGDWSDTGASALAVTTAGLARLRHPIPQLGQVRNGPVRAVYEGSLAVYSGDQDDVFDIPWLGRAGVGLEIETGLTRPDRARVMVRYVFGDDFNAVAIGGALQF